ncbi:PREDICTED: Kv channel-interacting protein 1-like isoform X2 [Priapulus caudatus]|uniref:Kv channel-interacting protein 1-like isoform X2 n=1 Tax=Priapulus caudatus TaxID=37621 RepID=A0ABM1DZG8_PRICU|nr:PREDICTED: Kv channel-interacting protein 1-like isoform X2 [Priapulus caudatus]
MWAAAQTAAVRELDPASSAAGSTSVCDAATQWTHPTMLSLVPLLKLKGMFKAKGGRSRSGTDHDMDDLEMQVVRYKPEGLDALCKTTRFSRKELQMMYRGFKQECPTGMVNEDTFKDIYAQFFPQGDASQYAHYVFQLFDQNRNGHISFEDFVLGLSVLARGTVTEKLNWAFNLYDINHDGYITKDEMLDIVSSIYDMLGAYTEPMVEENTAHDHVEAVFEMDLNKDGVITLDEFMECCLKDDAIIRGLAVLDTVL